MITYQPNAGIREAEPVNHNPNLIPDYYDRFTEWTDNFTGQAFKAKIIYACSRIVHGNDKNERSFKREDLKITLYFKHSDVEYYYTHTMLGSREYEGEGGATNPAQLNAFMYLITKLNPNATSETFHYQTDYAEGDVYPEMCGTVLIFGAATTGQREWNGRIFKNNRITFYALDKRAPYEIKDNVPANECMAFKADMISGKEDYQKYATELNGTQASPYNQAQPVQIQPVGGAANNPVEHYVQEISNKLNDDNGNGGNSNDDIPF